MMIRPFFYLLIIILRIQGLGAQEIQYARSVVEDLASPAMHGRGFAYNGINKAAKYIIKEYKKNGALPVNGSYSQWFRMSINTFRGPVRLSVDNTVLKPAIDFLPDPSSPGIKGTYGITEINLADILSGTVVFKMHSATKDQLLYLNPSIADTLLNDEQKKAVTDFMENLKSDMSLRAAGVIETKEGKLTWHLSGQCYYKPWIAINHSLSVDSLSRIKIALKNRLLQEQKTSNIIGYFKGTLKPDSFIILTAHYDHIGSLGKEVFFPGANDNASGVAMLLSLIKYYAKYPPTYSLLFMATSAEESGFTGAQFYVENPVIELEKVRFLINFDLVGTGEEGIMVVNGPLFRREFEKLVTINDRDSLLPGIKMREEACNSDHCPFFMKGIPCFFIYTLGGSASYHDLFDIPDALSMKAFENYAMLMVRFIAEL
jgi:aminopeptidase YwaD